MGQGDTVIPGDTMRKAKRQPHKPDRHWQSGGYEKTWLVEDKTPICGASIAELEARLAPLEAITTLLKGLDLMHNGPKLLTLPCAT